MDCLNLNDNSNFLWDVKLLGECLQLNDREILVIFNNSTAAKIISQDNLIAVIKLNVECYNPLTLWSNKTYSGLKYREALNILKQLKGD